VIPGALASPLLRQPISAEPPAPPGGVPIVINITTDTADFNCKTAALNNGWDGVTPADITVNLAAVLYGSTPVQFGPATYAFDTDENYPEGTTLKLVVPANSAYRIVGSGGEAGWLNLNLGPQAPGNGGTAIKARVPITIDCQGVLGGGGGGGSAGAGGSANAPGGTGAGLNAATAGTPSTVAGGAAGANGQPGQPGVTATGANLSGGGGGGGGLGAVGGVGGGGRNFNNIPQTALPGGLAGKAVEGNQFITWINQGTVYGAIT
jgi:hypothetical protein